MEGFRGPLDSHVWMKWTGATKTRMSLHGLGDYFRDPLWPQIQDIIEQQITNWQLFTICKFWVAQNIQRTRTLCFGNFNQPNNAKDVKLTYIGINKVYFTIILIPATLAEWNCLCWICIIFRANNLQKGKYHEVKVRSVLQWSFLEFECTYVYAAHKELCNLNQWRMCRFQ